MNPGTEDEKARQLYGKARDQLRNMETLRWDQLPPEARALYTRLVRVAFVDAIQGGNAIRRDVLEYWGKAAARVSDGQSGCVVAIGLEPDGFVVSGAGPMGSAEIRVPFADIMTAITPKGAIDEIIGHLLGQVRMPKVDLRRNGA